nr:hypothetical protein JVH1_4234 [Rhodococcus sp. JVH1]
MPDKWILTGETHLRRLQKNHPVVTGFDFVVHDTLEPQGGIFYEDRSRVSDLYRDFVESSGPVLARELSGKRSLPSAENRHAKRFAAPHQRPRLGGSLHGDRHQTRI